MGSMKKSLGGSIHRIREFELEKVNLADEFDILQIVGEGWFGKILLVEHKATDTEMVLKALPKPYTSLKDFYREFHYGLHLGAHKNIITTYDVSFETAGFYVFSQEYAPLGDLTSNVSDTGIGELHTKRVAKQLAAALEHLHTRDLVHRDVKLDNVLVFRSDFARIKLCDFGETRRVGSQVPRRNEWLPYAPPEVLMVETDHSYKAHTSHDVWQFGIVIFVCLTGCLPWQKAAPEDPRYGRYLAWHTNSMLKRQPKLFRLIASRAQRLFRKYLEPRPEKRPAGLADMYRYLDDRWHSKAGIQKTTEIDTEEEGLCPSMYSFHSSAEEKNKLLFTLTQYGLETTVDRGAKKDRIKDWIQSSVIEEVDETIEEGEDEEENSEEEEAVMRVRDAANGPIGERTNRGPITATKVNRRHSTVSLRSVRNLPPIDPRIPLEQQKDKIKMPIPQPQVQQNGAMHHQGVPQPPEVNFASFGIQIPFQNTQIPKEPNNNNNTVNKYKVQVQIPQSQYMIPINTQLSRNGHHQNGNAQVINNRSAITSGYPKVPPRSPLAKRSMRDEKQYGGAYARPPIVPATSKSSSSNSNSTERSSGRRT